MYEQQGAAARNYVPEVTKVPLVEEAFGDVQFVVNELQELMMRVRTYADGFLGSRPTGMPTSAHVNSVQAPPSRGEALRITVNNLKNASKELADEISRLSGI